MRPFDQPGRSTVYASQGVAATSHPLATATALSVLRDGGNAVDASIAAAATLAVVEPHMTGIGGDCFAIVSDGDGILHGINGSGRASRHAEVGYFAERGIQDLDTVPAHTVTAPGSVRSWEALHQRFGTMDFARLFADAVRYAEDGYPVHARQAMDWGKSTDKLKANEGASRHFLKSGAAPDAGEVMACPALGECLARIAKEGSSAFYEGEIAADIAATVKAAGGQLDEEDLAGVTADWVDPVSREFCGHQVHEIPPNGQGVTALILAGLIERAGLPDNPASAARYHQEIELGRIAYAVRDAHVADPADMIADVDYLLSDDHLDALFSRYDRSRRNPSIDLPDLPGSDTVYLCTADASGMMVSFINSIYGDFGAGIATSQTGILLQNRGACFTLQPGHPNCIGPGKRPMHTIIPGFLTRDGRPAAAFGVMGGAYQPMGQAHVLTNMLHFGMDPQAALDHPRLFWDADGVLHAESGIAASVVDDLRRFGHDVHHDGLYGGGQIIAIDHERGVYRAGSDPRKDGHAAGY